MRGYATRPGGDPEVRANAIFWLGQRGGVQASGFLRELYAELDDPELRERVLFSVAQSPGDPANLEWLTERALDETEEMEVRTQALFWAGQAGMEAGAVLRVFRTADDAELREQAIFVLTQMPDSDEAVDALMEIARGEEDPELRERAVFWLGQSDDPRVAEFLLELIRRGGGGR
jgi:HEAT repeat protein